MKTTVGSILVNEPLPESLRDYDSPFDKKLIKKKLTEVARNHPNIYGHVVSKIKKIGDIVSYNEGASFSLQDLIPIKERDDVIKKAKKYWNN